jgi:Protein of unknown function (DUF3592)
MLDAHQLLWTQIAAGVCLLNFACLLFRLVRLLGQRRSASTWSKVDGVITTSEVDLPPSHVSDDETDATPVIRYRYRIEGNDLEGDRIGIGEVAMTTRLLAMQQAARYPLGAHVDVYVNPKNPKRALLEPRAQNDIAGTVVFAVVFGVIALVLTAHAIAGHVLYADNGVPMFAFALPGAAILVAILGVTSFVRTRRLASASTRWPSVSGTVTTSSVVEEQIEDDGDNDNSTRRMVYRYQIDLRYAYRVNARDYVGTSAGFGWTAIYGEREGAETAAGRYAPGDNVPVYYDPDHPATAVLEPDNRQGSFAPLVFSAIFAVAGGGILAFLIKVGFDH